jgi:type II secretory pathway component PulF
VWSAVHDDVVGGISLAEALEKWPKVFSTVYVAMVRAGEAGGFLHVVLQQIADFRTQEQELKGKVKAAMVYPCVLGLLAVAVLIFLLTFFIPRFSGIFKEFGGALPWLTQVIVALSQGIMKYGLIAGGVVVAAVVAFRRAQSTQGGRRAIERAFLRIPGVGKVIARFALVRFCRMLGTLAGAGVPLVSSLKVAKEALGNQTLADTVEHAITEVQRGASLAKSLANSAQLFPPSVVEMITVAEETGRLDKELTRLSVTFEADLDRELRMLVALAEPIMLFVMAGVIGTVVVGMLLPVFNLQDLMH